MTNLATRLLGRWIVEMVAVHMADQKSLNGDKLFTKVAGIDDEAWGEVLSAFRSSVSRLTAYYHPVIRTLKSVEGYAEYQCDAHETSTWLRNNTPSGSALLICMNEVSPEAQSLENLFTIDEARLLGENGLEILYKLLAEEYSVYGQEMEALKGFFEMLNRRIFEPQLRNVLSFMAAILQSDSVSMVDKIQQNLDQLLLFRDRRFSLKSGEGYPRLRRNYLLSRLERDGRAAKQEDYIENLYAFLDKTTNENGGHELWEQDGVDREVFRKQALAFIHNQSYDLLQYEFDHIEAALSFRAGKESFQDRFNKFKEQSERENPWTPEQQRIAADMLEAVQDNENPDAAELFRQEFGDELKVVPTFAKEIERKINRLKQFPEYGELSDALLRESMLLLEEQGEEGIAPGTTFVLRLTDNRFNEQAYAMLRFHLLQLEKLTGYIRFDASSMPLELADQEKNKDVSFRLTLCAYGQEGTSSNFKWIDAFSGTLPSMIEKLKENSVIPYFQKFSGNEMRQVDICGIVRDNVKGYIAAGETEIQTATETFESFANSYTTMLRSALEGGVGSIDYEQLEDRLAKLLQDAYSNAHAAKYVYQAIGLFGALDRFQRKMSDSVGSVQERVLTLFNPLRLLSYAKRLSRVRDVLRCWMDAPEDGFGNELTAYLEHLQEETAHLFPRYFTVEGASGQYLIEQQERMGEGEFAINGKAGGESGFVHTFAEEFLSTVRTYLEVYPYAADCLDLVFLYCPHSEYVTKAIDQVFKHMKNVRKVKAIIHSATQGAAIHEQLNAWVNQEERYTENHNSFPRVEIQVIAESSLNEMMKTVNNYLKDADIGILVNYFGQSSHIQQRLERVSVEISDNWFDTLYREPLKQGDAVKRISFVSEKLPKLMQSFYQLQAVLNMNEAIASDEHYLLRNFVSVSDNADSVLMNYLHEQCNWTFFMDRYLDKSLLRHVSSKAHIIKYKSNAGKNKDWRTLLSSSRYIRKLSEKKTDHAYYDRLHQKYMQLLKNDQIDLQAIVQATERIQDISGGIVLRAIGPGKYAHELMAMYLSTQARTAKDDELVVWSVCDELPWFNGSSRRPDLVRTSIMRQGERFRLAFELIELKFISYTIFDTERFDAIKQVKAGMELYRNRFLFGERPSRAELGRKELTHYLLEYGTYSTAEAVLLRQFQGVPIELIDASVSGSIDTFVYTSNMQDRSMMEGHVDGYQTELLNNEYMNHIYNRAYILKALGASQESEEEVPEYGQLQEWAGFVVEKLGVMIDESQDEPESQETGGAEAMMVAETRLVYGDERTDVEVLAAVREISAITQAAPAAEIKSELFIGVEEEHCYPELLALRDERMSDDGQPESIDSLVEGYQRKLKYNFNQRGIPIKIVDSFIGVSVIRMIVEIPADKSYSSIENRAQDIYLWLELTALPMIALRNGRINIDINRLKPETVYFENFMQLVRSEYPPERLKGKLIAPIGVGQLRELIAMDFSSSNTPHLLVGGATGSGKSVTINSIILAMMCMYTPSEVQFMFIDPKNVEFQIYENRMHTKQIITNIEDAIHALEQLVEEMETRYRLFAQESATSIDEYVELTGRSMPRLVMVFDEFADFMEREKNLSSRVESAIGRLGAKARASGIHLLICTQSPKADIVPTNIRNNLPARLALKAADHHASKIIINEEGAEKLGGKGDFLIRLDMPETVRAKSPFLTPLVKRALLKHFENKQPG